MAEGHPAIEIATIETPSLGDRTYHTHAALVPDRPSGADPLTATLVAVTDYYGEYGSH
jgi:hypothetical protein